MKTKTCINPEKKDRRIHSHLNWIWKMNLNKESLILISQYLRST